MHLHPYPLLRPLYLYFKSSYKLSSKLEEASFLLCNLTLSYFTQNKYVYCTHHYNNPNFPPHKWKNDKTHPLHSLLAWKRYELASGYNNNNVKKLNNHSNQCSMAPDTVDEFLIHFLAFRTWFIESTLVNEVGYFFARFWQEAFVFPLYSRDTFTILSIFFSL